MAAKVHVPESLPRTIGRYQVQSVIGRGMMGVVYEALDPQLGRTVALKSVQLAFAVSPAEQQAFERRFLAEARAAAGLAHPAVVVVHDLGRDPDTGSLYIAFERLRGRTLDELVAREGPLEWRRALGLTARLADALHQAHQRGIVHRDIKPANIMVLDGGQPKIMDFGIAKVPALELTSAGQFLGTPSYMSPEQLASDPVDGRSDLFSLGAVLYFMVTGRLAFAGDTIPATLALVTFRDPTPPSALVPGLPPAIDHLAARALAKSPADRYPDGASFAQDAEDLLAGRPPRHRAGWTPPTRATFVSPAVKALAAGPAPPAPVPRTTAAAVSRRGVLVIAGVLAAAALAGVVLLPTARQLVPSAPLAPAPALLEVDLEHPLKSGTLRIWIDEKVVLEEPLESSVTEDLLVVKVRKGRERATLEVRPGEHEVRVQVTGDGFNRTRRLSAAFDSGGSRRLVIRVGGVLSRELDARWGT